MNLPVEVASAFGPDGPMTKLPDYERRLEQVLLAQRIAQTFNQTGRLVAEAGTGVGKSMAYLVPAILSNSTVLVSTYTKALQDQLLNKDIPFLQQHFQPFTAVKVKGRSNYLCLLKSEDLQEAIEDREAEPLTPGLQEWIHDTVNGDIEEYPGTLSGELRSKLTISTEDCSHSKCPKFNECFAEGAKRAARQAKIIVVNHALLMIDLNNASILPPVDHIVIDEAHHLVDAATGMQEVEMTLIRVNTLLRASVAKIDLFPQDLAGRISSIIYSWFEGFAIRLGNTDRLSYDSPLPYHMDAVESLLELVEWWRTHGQTVRSRVAEMTALDEKAQEVAIEQVGKESDKLMTLYNDFKDLANAEEAGNHAYWIQRDRSRSNFNYSLRKSPISVANWLSESLWRTDTPKAPSVVAVSATISVGDDFSLFLRETGCPQADTLVQGSPFDFERQALYYIPQIPPPSGPIDSDDRQDVMAWEIQRVTQACPGGVFILFTAWARCRYMYERLYPALTGQRPVYMQGDYPTGELISRFRKDGNGVLFGTKSFWEGVDVRGDALMVVMIDRLPFPTPADPLYQARSRHLEEMGQRPFFALAVPGAAIALKQGMGRLIRSENDRGIVVFLDSRIVEKGYGKIIRDSLPPAPITREFQDVESFLDDFAITF